MRITQAIPFILASIAGIANADNEIYAIHGSGTTNPSKCIWHIMSLFEERSRVKTQFTYRAVGSSTGQKEFLGKDNQGSFMNFTTGELIEMASHVPHNDFGAGDIPIKTTEYDLLTSAYGEDSIAHLPFAMSSVSFFHNIPGVPDGEGGIKLNACLLARIFGGKTQEWDAPEILEVNDHLADVLKGKIYVARRVRGSSSTKGITQFLGSNCAKEWEEKYVGSELSEEKKNMWHESTNPCQGSAGMTKCIKENAGAIGYIDSGHGWSEELKEVNVMNTDGRYLTSRFSHSKDGIANAANSGTTPKSVTADWGDVNFLNKSGEYTWPIVVMSYIYIRTDLHKFIKDEHERGLLKLFLEAIYDKKNYFSACEELGFSQPPQALVTMATTALNDATINWDFSTDDGKNMWTFEFDTEPIAGQGKYVISKKRRSLAGVSIEDLAGAEKKLKGDVEFVKSAFHDMFVTEEGEIKDIFEVLAIERKRNNAALVLGAISITLWICAIVGYALFGVRRYKSVGS